MNKIESAVQYVLILLLCFFSFFVNNRALPADLMESRNLATAQEMTRLGNYLVPTMNGELRLEKPPLPTWIAAGVELLSPENLGAQRAMAGLAATLMVIFLYLLVKRISGEEILAFLSALVLATSYNVVMMGRTATWDIYCHAFMLGAIFCLVRALQKEGPEWKNFIGAGVCMGLSFLSKGPVSFFALLLPFLIGYRMVYKPSLKGKWMSVLVMVALCLLLSFAWPVYIALFHPEAGMAVAKKESAAWLGHNTRPLWYYWKFPAEAGIWAFFWVTSIIYFFWYRKKRPDKAFTLSIVWTLGALVLLSLMPEKKTRYLLPMLIPGAVNVAFYLWSFIRMRPTGWHKTWFRVNSWVIALVAFAVPVGVWWMARGVSMFSWGVLTLLCVAIGACIVRALFLKNGEPAGRVITGTVLLMVVFESLCIPVVAGSFVNNNRNSIGVLKTDPRVKGLSFYTPQPAGEIRMELVYELNNFLHPMDCSEDSVWMARMPFVFVSGEPVESYWEGKEVCIEYLGAFDNNWRKNDGKHWNPKLFNYVAIIRKCQPLSPSVATR